MDDFFKDFIRDVPLTVEEMEAETAEQQKRNSKKKKIKISSKHGAIEEQPGKVKKHKKKKNKMKNLDSNELEPAMSQQVRAPAFVIEAVAEALKPAFANHQVAFFNFGANLNRTQTFRYQGHTCKLA